MNSARNAERFDLVVVGRGEAGRYLASGYAKEGKRVAMITNSLPWDSHREGTRQPNRKVIYMAEITSSIGRIRDAALSSGGIVDVADLRTRKQRMVLDLVEIYNENLEKSGVTLIRGASVFIAPRVLDISLENGDSQTLIGDNVVIDTGTADNLDAIAGLRTAGPLTQDQAIPENYAPEHLIVLGGNFAGVEFAQAIRRLGSKVTILDSSDRLLPHEDEATSAASLHLLGNEGIEVVSGASVTRVRGHNGDRIQIEYEESSITRSRSATHLFLAATRTPKTEGIGLEATGIRLLENNFICVNERLETSSPGVWAVGSCAGAPEYSRSAFDDFRIVRAGIAGKDGKIPERLMPICLFTDPVYARIGLSEKEAQANRIPYRVAQAATSLTLRAGQQFETRGFLKALIATTSDAILGFTSFGMDSREVLSTVQTMMMARLPLEVLRNVTFSNIALTRAMATLCSSLSAV